METFVTVVNWLALLGTIAAGIGIVVFLVWWFFAPDLDD